MALTVTASFPTGRLPWGYEYRVNITDTETGQKYDELLSSPVPWTEETVAAAISAKLEWLAAALVTPVQEPQYQITCEDGTVLTV